MPLSFPLTGRCFLPVPDGLAGLRDPPCFLSSNPKAARSRLAPERASGSCPLSCASDRRRSTSVLEISKLDTLIPPSSSICAARLIYPLPVTSNVFLFYRLTSSKTESYHSPPLVVATARL